MNASSCINMYRIYWTSLRCILFFHSSVVASRVAMGASCQPLHGHGGCRTLQVRWHPKMLITSMFSLSPHSLLFLPSLCASQPHTTHLVLLSLYYTILFYTMSGKRSNNPQSLSDICKPLSWFFPDLDEPSLQLLQKFNILNLLLVYCVPLFYIFYPALLLPAICFRSLSYLLSKLWKKFSEANVIREEDTAEYMGGDDMNFWLQRCSICLDSKFSLFLDSCRDQFCSDCFARYALCQFGCCSTSCCITCVFLTSRALGPVPLSPCLPPQVYWGDCQFQLGPFGQEDMLSRQVILVT